MIYTEYGHISEGVAGYSAKELLKRGQSAMITERFAQAISMPKNRGQVVKFRRYLNLALALAPLQEGVSPAGQRITYEDVYATLRQYGDKVGITDVIEDTHEDPVLNEAIALIGEQIAQTFETIRLNMLKSGTNVSYAGTSATSRATVSATINRGLVREAVRQLKRNRAMTIGELVAPSEKIATEPVRRSFFSIAHTDLESDLRDMDGFVRAEYYAQDDAMPYEIGACEGVRFLCSDLFDPWLAAATSTSSQAFLSNGDIPTAASNPDVYPVVIIAKDSYGIVRLQGENAVKPIVLNPNRPAPGDELGQKGCVGWKSWNANVILNQTWLHRLEVAATASLG